MPIVAKNMEQQKTVERMRGALIGAYKAGKSTLLTTARKPVLFLDIDQRRESIAGKKGVYALTFTNPPGLGQQPTVYSDVLKVVSMIEVNRHIDFITKIDPTIVISSEDKGKQVETLVLDSLQSMTRETLSYSMYTNPKELARSISVGGQTLYFPSGWDTWNADMAEIEQLIGRMVGIPEIDFWVTFHEEDKGNMIDVFPGRHRQIIRLFNEVWRIQRKNNSGLPTVQFLPTPNFTAATTLVGIPGTIENPNIEDLIAKYGRKG